MIPAPFEGAAPTSVKTAARALARACERAQF